MHSPLVAAHNPRNTSATGKDTQGQPRTGHTSVFSHHVDHMHHAFVHMLTQVGLGWGGGEVSAVESADDKKDDKPALTGKWERKEGELKLEFADKTVLKISPHGKDEIILFLCEYTTEKDGLVKVKITGFEGKPEAKDKAKERLPVGTEFSFKWKVKGDAARWMN